MSKSARDYLNEWRGGIEKVEQELQVRDNRIKSLEEELTRLSIAEREARLSLESLEKAQDDSKYWKGKYEALSKDAENIVKKRDELQEELAQERARANEYKIKVAHLENRLQHSQPTEEAREEREKFKKLAYAKDFELRSLKEKVEEIERDRDGWRKLYGEKRDELVRLGHEMEELKRKLSEIQNSGEDSKVKGIYDALELLIKTGLITKKTLKRLENKDELLARVTEIKEWMEENDEVAYVNYRGNNWNLDDVSSINDKAESDMEWLIQFVEETLK